MRSSRRSSAKDSDMPVPLTPGEIRAIYRIMETRNPFPDDQMRRAAPLTWKIAEALGRATSLHPSCVFVHLLILIATTLGAVQIKYGGILGRFCNLLMLQRGAPGDGKSIALWLDLQVLHHYDHVRTKMCKTRYDKEVFEYNAAKERRANGDQDAPQLPEPQKPAVKDSVFNKGTFVGLGGHMHGQDETAFLALHEGRLLVQSTNNMIMQAPLLISQVFKPQLMAQGFRVGEGVRQRPPSRKSFSFSCGACVWEGGRVGDQ